MIIIKNVTIIPMTHEVAFYGAVAIEGTKIVMVAQGDAEAQRLQQEFAGDVEVIDGKGGVLMPGLINLHNHASMSLLRSYADDMPLMPWLTDHIWPAEDKMTPQHIYVGAKLGIAEMLLGGTTTFVDMYGCEDMVAKAAVDMGARTVLGVAFTDGSYSRFELFMLDVMQQYGNEPLVDIRMSPHAPYTCSPDTMKQAIAFAKKHNLAVHTHISETLDEVAQVKERYGKTSTEYFRDLGLFELKTLAAHCVHVTSSDMDILSECGVAVSHNPQSNMKLASGFAPVLEMMDKGINVGIGTDGPSSNNDLDMWEEMRAASFMHKCTAYDATVLPAYQILEMVTVNGAKGILRDDLGKIAVGMTADLILVDISRPHFYPRHDLIANLVYCGKASDVDTVIVGGEVVVRGKELVKESLEQLYDEVDVAINEMGIGGDA